MKTRTYYDDIIRKALMPLQDTFVNIYIFATVKMRVLDHGPMPGLGEVGT